MSTKSPALLFLAIIVLVCTNPSAAADAPKAIQAVYKTLCASLPADGQVRRIAIFPFDDKRGEKDNGRAVAEYLITLFSDEKRFQLVDRTDFLKMIAEIELGQSDLMGDSGAVKAGKMLNAEAICTGTIADLFGTVRISAKIIRTETTEVLASASVPVGKNELDALTKDLLNEKSKISSAVFRSMVVPGWGQMYTDHYVRGGVSLAAFAGAVGYLIYKAQMSANAYQTFESDRALLNDSAETWANRIGGGNSEKYKVAWDSIWRQDTVNYDKYSKYFNQTLVVGGVAIAIYALNLVDAAIAGMQSKRKFKLYFSGDLRRNFGAGVAYRF